MQNSKFLITVSLFSAVFFPVQVHAYCQDPLLQTKLDQIEQKLFHNPESQALQLAYGLLIYECQSPSLTISKEVPRWTLDYQLDTAFGYSSNPLQASFHEDFQLTIPRLNLSLPNEQLAQSAFYKYGNLGMVATYGAFQLNLELMQRQYQRSEIKDQGYSTVGMSWAVSDSQVFELSYQKSNFQGHDYTTTRLEGAQLLSPGLVLKGSVGHRDYQSLENYSSHLYQLGLLVMSQEKDLTLLGVFEVDEPVKQRVGGRAQGVGLTLSKAFLLGEGFKAVVSGGWKYQQDSDGYNALLNNNQVRASHLYSASIHIARDSEKVLSPYVMAAAMYQASNIELFEWHDYEVQLGLHVNW